MGPPPYMKLFVADYLADTIHLTTEQHGAYILLLMAMWRAGGRLPANDAKLAAIAKKTPAEWAEMRDTVLAFFRRRGGQISHKRLSQELSKAETVSCVRREASALGVAEKRRKNNGKTQPNGRSKRDQKVAYSDSYITPLTPQGGQVDFQEWNGPEEVREVVVHRLGKPGGAYLRQYCTWREVPERALVVRSATIFAKLRDCQADLKAIGWALILEQEQVA